jgi:hypothetical protein
MIPHPPLRHGWQVQTNDALHRGWELQRPMWFWSAWGPHGFQSGAENDPHAATEKAHAASLVLADLSQKKAQVTG